MNKTLLVFLVIVFIACVYVIYYARTPVQLKSKIHFISFYTSNLQEAKEIFERSIKKYVDTCRFYTDVEFRENPTTSVYVKQFPLASPYNPGLEKVAFGRWKPYILLKTMENIPYGDIVMYRDCNVVKYPNYLVNIEQTREMVHTFMSETDFFVPIESTELKVKYHCKREMLEAFGVFEDPSYMDALLLNVSVIICRKTETTMQILREWLYWCMRDDLIDISITMTQIPDFRWYTPEQGILNLVLRKKVMKEGFYMPQYLYTDRIISMDMKRFC